MKIAGKIVKAALMIGIALLMILSLLEALVRAAGQIDNNGRFTFREYVLEPADLPVSLPELRGEIEHYLKQQDESSIIYDPMLGWAYRPNTIRQHRGPFTVNSAGLRSQREYSEAPPADTLRIALFGDSFTAGDSVSDDETWGHQLEMKLNQAGIRAEVLNFGVGGYGMDQAFLRWQHMGRDYSPDIVIFGFQAENINRNVNIFTRLLYPYPGILSKPRYILDSQKLKLLNSPAIPPEQLLAVYESFADHPLAPHEAHYKGRDTAGQWWQSSRLAWVLHAALNDKEFENWMTWGESSERYLMGKAIVDAFAADAAEREAAFFVLHLPRRQQLGQYYIAQAPYYFQPLVDYYSDTYHYIASEEYIVPSYHDDVYFPDLYHYGPEISGIIAQTVAAEIQTCVESPSCDLPRFEDRDALIHP